MCYAGSTTFQQTGATARCAKESFRFSRLLSVKPHGPERERLLLLTRDVEMDTIFIRTCQEEEFFDEIRCLKETRCLTNRKGTVNKCSPYLVPVGVLRMQGRIDAIENVEVSVKRPVILSRHHRIAYLLVEYHHRKYHHLHAEIVVNEVRQKYWIPGLRALVMEIINNCPACCIRRAQPIPPMIGTLPKERLSPHTLPFTFTGVDYFGPNEVAVGRRREKR